MKTVNLNKIIGLFFLTLSQGVLANNLSAIIETQNGRIQGYEKKDFTSFQGIPYAEAPIGDRRWEPPVNKRKWSDVYIAGKFGNTCATASSLGGFSKISDSEDCLYLNVYVPKQATNQSKKKSPVLFWIPGGGLQTGSGDEYDPTYFTNRGIVVVTINYRVGPFGFFYKPAPNTEKSAPVNLGLMDQQAALKWVNQNIERFGGDAKNITVSGESAGGQSVLANVFSPLSKNLFQKSIALSGSYYTDVKSLDDAKNKTALIAKKLNCHGNDKQLSACLKSKPTELFLTSEMGALFNDGFYVDNYTLTNPFFESIKNNEINVKSMINGFNTDEGTFFAGVMELGKGSKLNRDDYIKSLANLYGKNAKKEVIEKTNSQVSVDATRALAEDLGKYKFVCPSIRFNNALSQKIPLFGFEFGDKTAPQYIKSTSIAYGAHHTSELAYIFKDFYGASGKLNPLTPEQKKLSDTMLSYWSNFIYSDSPNNSQLVDWKAYSPTKKSILLFAEGKATLKQNIDKEWSCP